MPPQDSVLFVVGTRPEAIKLAQVIRAYRRVPDTQVKLCVTGQHRELLAATLEPFDLKPDFDLNLMSHGQSLEAITSSILARLPEVLKASCARLVFVQGDTQFDLGVWNAAVRANHLGQLDRLGPSPHNEKH